MTRLMYDSTSPWEIPRDAEMIAYYVDGRYAWPREWLDMFPRAVKVSISAIGARTAQVGDVEVGCIWPPANAVPWVRRARADGHDPTIYVNELNDWLAVRQAFRNAGEPEPHYWTARYNGVREIPVGAIARQFAHPHDGDGVANYPWETGAHYDLSVVADHWPGVDQTAPGGGGGQILEEEMSSLLIRSHDDPTVFRVTWNADGCWKSEVGTEYNLLVASDVKVYFHNQVDVDQIPTRSDTGRAVWNYLLPTGEKNAAGEDVFVEAHEILTNVNVRVSDVVADVDEGALAEALEARGIMGASPAQVKEALVSVLRSVPAAGDEQA